MAANPEFLDHLTDQLAAFGPVQIRRMFGGAGLFRDGLMFALITGDDIVYLKVDDRNRPDFESAGSGPFSYQRAGKAMALKSYYETPEDVVEDDEVFTNWARKAFDAALAADKAKSGKKKPA